ncbi:MAG: hypothetical protein A2386_03360 [Elusimicrobia bacterium RIFOXYB1_FULL_48_9]|nr:MAG: hypothetical protein A2386_03360 [Elusimicrobia bacterium RIFOXYB1_FULL_48_9]
MTALSLIAPVYAASPDLSVSGTDITFSNNTPEPSENISISAVIKNNGGLYSYEIPFGKHDYMVGVSSDYTSVCSTISWGQYFIPAENMYLGKVSLLINNIGETSDAMGVEIRRTEASSFIRPSLQSYDKLAYTAVVSTFTSFGWQDFEFDTAAYLVSGTTYWICAYNLSDKANGYQLWLDSGTTLDCLAGSTDLGSTWSSIAAIPGKWNVFFKAFKSTSTFVGFYAGNPDSGGLLIGSTVYQTPIPAGSSRSETFQWAAVNGSTDIYVTVDYPGGIINETLENNNVAYKNITVAPTYPAITGSVSPPENAADVGVNDIISAVFSEYMSSSTVVPAITVKAVRDSAGVAISEAAGGTVEYSTSSKTLTFSALWKKGYKYQVTISTGAQDLYGNAMAAAKIWEFTITDMPALSGTVSPAEDAIGIAVSEPARVTFLSDDMDPAAAKSAISVRAVKDNLGADINEPVSGTVEYSDKTLSFSALWKKGYKYRVTVSTDAKDLYGNAIISGKIWQFTTVVDCLAENIFTAGDSATKVTIVPGAVDFDYYIIIDTSPAIGTLLTDADGKAIGLRGPYAGAVNSGVRKFLMYKGTYAGTLAGDKFQKSVSIVIPYAENGDGFVTTSNGRLVKENTLSIYGLDETKKLWVRNPNSEVDTVKNTVTARVNHFSIYAVSGNSDTDLSSAYAYPVPWKPFDGKDETGTESGGITFTGLSSQATIRVYTVSGELVRALDYNFSGGKEELVWDGKNSSGESVASGLYVYYIENAREHKSGKIIIIK